jgi:thioredoxin 1
MGSVLARLDQFTFHHTLAATPGGALVIFTGPACGACRRLKGILNEHVGEFADLHLFEVDAGEDMALTREFEVFHLPALFLFRDGHFHCELHSEAQPHLLRRAIDAAFAAPPQEQP